VSTELLQESEHGQVARTVHLLIECRTSSTMPAGPRLLLTASPDAGYRLAGIPGSGDIKVQLAGLSEHRTVGMLNPWSYAA
jgi:hypothetical protein